MNYKIILFLLITKYCVSKGDKWKDKDKSDGRRIEGNGDNYEEWDDIEEGNNDYSNNKESGSVGDSNQKDYDEQKHLHYPCRRFKYQDECVSRVLASKGKCKRIPKEKQKRVIYRDEAITYLPNFNITVLLTKSELTGFDGKIEQFYVNKSSGNLVYSAKFDKLNIYSKRSYFSFQRIGKEPIVTYDFVNVTYFSVTLTAVIPIKYGISLEKSRVTAFIGSNPILIVGPGVTANPDPVVQTSVIALNANLATAAQEAFLTDSANYFYTYLTYYICDFGISL